MLLNVGLILADQRVRDLLAGIQIFEDHRGSEAYSVQGEAIGIDHLGPGELVLDLRDATLDVRLSLLGSVVLGVLGQVTVRTSQLDRLYCTGALLDFQTPHFFLQGLLGGADNNPRDQILTVGEMCQYLQVSFAREVIEEVSASTSRNERGNQHLVIDRGGVALDDVLIAAALL